jgi:hypothetical protein
MPIRHLTVTGTLTAFFIAATQAATNAALLHAVRGATDIEVDLVVAEILADLGRHREVARIGAAELKRHGMFASIEAKQALPVTMDDGA